MAMLGFDTSLATTSVAIMESGAPDPCWRSPLPSEASLLGRPGHSRDLLPSIRQGLEVCGLRWADIDSIAVGVGPGTFTGLRIGVATARALGQALDVPLVPVGSLEALAAGFSLGNQEQPRLPVIDARRGQVFAALYEPGQVPGDGPAWGPEALDPEILLERVSGLQPVVAGDWALKHRDLLETAGSLLPDYDTGLHAVDATHICRLASTRTALGYGEIEPAYLRLPDAELNLRKREEAVDVNG